VKFVSEFRDPKAAKGLLASIHRRSKTPVRFMEFCGGHTVTICRNGVRQALPDTISMVSGPGCPVCVTATADLDKAIAMARIPDMIIATFGDMMRVPGSRASLERTKAGGADVRVVYSPLDALAIARANANRRVVFLGVGFETTAPAIAASILTADEKEIGNYSVLSLHKLCPPVIRALLEAGDVKLDGLICPGHVSAVIGSRPWAFIASEFGIPCVVTGFELLDVLHGIDRLTAQVEAGEAKVEIAYGRGVKRDGNAVAMRLTEQVFEPAAAEWRGIGTLPESGLRIRDNYRRFDAERLFEIDPGAPDDQTDCICGDILRGTRTPPDCRSFGTRCTPETPIGPCMVSSEGSCSAYYLYGGGSHA
jgi:hydrogenase expression/formation protein HypD